MDQNNNVINNLQPKSAFKAGLFSGIALMFIVGFFILLGLMLNKDKEENPSPAANNNNPSVVVPNQPNDPTPTAINLQAVDKNNDWIRGDKNTPVTIVEFSDLNCSFCAKHHETMKQIIAEYAGQVNWVYRHFAILGPESSTKAEAAECVGELGGENKFWEYLDKLFAEGGTSADLADKAVAIGINKNSFETCLDSGKYSSKIQNQSAQAQAAGGRGTPYSIIVAGSQKIPINGALPIDSIRQSLDLLVN